MNNAESNMRKLKVFFSSVQNEFAKERQMLFDYLMQDALLGLFFEPFIFEKVPASNQRVDNLYLDEVTKCDIYIGIFGKDYGKEDADGISPTEREFDLATKINKYRIIFITSHNSAERHSKEAELVRKAEKEITRKMFSTPIELKTAIYTSLIHYLKEKEYLRTCPFDASINSAASLFDIDSKKVSLFVKIAKSKRGFPLPAVSSTEDILTHLNLLNNNGLSNASLLLFGKNPQKFFINSEVKCAHFHGYEIVKPIPSYQVYKGDVFMLVDQAVDFVLSHIDVSTGNREKNVQVDIEYEIPRAVVAEAIVNAVVHRDYTSTGSVQIMLFKDRLEVWNPGQLPTNLTLEKLRTPHSSFPFNPLLAEPMYLAGYIERMGTGTRDIIRLCNEKKLKEPEFLQEDVFKTILWRTGQATGQATGQVIPAVSEPIRRVILVMKGEMKRAVIQKILGLKHRENFIENYMVPSLESDIIEMTHPETPNHPNQKYRLTEKGLEIQKKVGEK